MALDGIAPRPHHQQPAHPVPASLRWGLSWTVLVASLGIVAGYAAGSSVEAPAEYDGTSIVTTTIEPATIDATCVSDGRGTPDAIEHRIETCQATMRLPPTPTAR